MTLTAVDRRVCVARAVLEAISPLHVGAGRGDDVSDADVVRDMNDLPTIPGTSLAGVLRQGFREACRDERREQRVFGHQTGDEGHGSRLVVSFGLVLDSRGVAVEGLETSAQVEDSVLRALRPARTPVRHHVRIDHRGVADSAGHGRFDERLVPAGCRFVLELGLVGSDDGLDEDFELLLGLLGRGLRLGGHTRRGLGRMRLVQLAGRPFDLTKAADCETFAKLPVSLAAPAPGLPLREARAIPHDRPRARLRIRPRTPWVIGGQEPWEMEDVTVHREPWIRWDSPRDGRVEPARVVVPATAIKGVLAHRVAWHDQVLALAERPDRAAARALVGAANPSVRALFGAGPLVAEGTPAEAGHLALDDAVLDAPPGTDVLHHSGIDRFTGGVRAGVLFSERLVRPGAAFETELEILSGADVPARARRALARALDDLRRGQWQLGQGFGRGHGWVAGEVEWLSGAEWLEQGGR